MKTAMHGIKKWKLIRALTCLVVMFGAFSSPGFSPGGHFSITPFVGTDIVAGVDYSTLQNLVTLDREWVDVYVGGTGWVNIYAHQYDAYWEDGGKTRFVFHPDLSAEDALGYAEFYAEYFGCFPKFARMHVDKYVLNSSGDSGGGKAIYFNLENNLNNYVAKYIQTVYTLHESLHADPSAYCLDDEYLEAVAADGQSWSDYGAKKWEEITVHGCVWTHVRLRPERCSKEHYEAAYEKIPNRMAFFDNLDLDPYPLNRPVAAPVIDDTATLLVTYTPTNDWSCPSAVDDSFLGHWHGAETVGAAATFEFSGSKATLYGMKRSDLGMADIYIDGEHVESVDFYSSEEQFFEPIYQTPELAVGDHTLTVAANGKYNPAATEARVKIIVDALQYEVGDLNDATAPAKPANLSVRVGHDTVRLDWDASAAADLYGYNIYRTAPGGARILVDAYVPKNYYLDTRFHDDNGVYNTSGTYLYEVTAVDTRGNESDARAVSPVVELPVLVDNESSSVAYDGFSSFGSNQAYNGTQHRGNLPGRTAALNFTGQQAFVYGQKRNDLGYADIYIDGVYQETVDFYHSRDQFKALIYKTPVLSYGKHTLTVEARGDYNPSATNSIGRIIIDYFAYLDQTSAETDLTPNLRVNGGAWQEAETIHVHAGDNLYLSSKPNTSSGSWNWFGPNRVRDGNRKFWVGNIQPDQAGEYRVVYVNANGVKSTCSIKVHVTDPTPARKITPNFQLNSDGWTQVGVVMAEVGDRLQFGPRPQWWGGLTWSWSGPNGFSSSSRNPWLTDIKASDAGYYTVTSVDGNGTESGCTYLVNVRDPVEGQNFFTQSYTGTRNNFKGWVGYEFTPSEDLTIEALGRPVSGSMEQYHNLKVWRVSSQSVVASARVTPSSVVDSYGHAYEKLSDPVTLSAGVTFRIASWERVGGDSWRNAGDISGHTDVADIHKGVYGSGYYSYPSGNYWANEHGYSAPTFYYVE